MVQIEKGTVPQNENSGGKFKKISVLPSPVNI
jgi:hypothetical protein